MAGPRREVRKGKSPKPQQYFSPPLNHFRSPPPSNRASRVLSLNRTATAGFRGKNIVMASEKQIAANRRNAQKSTGPRTQAGKEYSDRKSTRLNSSHVSI